ncbi:hypothetical protein [Bradyrhizobium zhanjiangense]|nr:hypothetical protein [Bradyrhizobium zhanjiangense]
MRPLTVDVFNDALKGSYGADVVRYSCCRPRSPPRRPADIGRAAA